MLVLVYLTNVKNLENRAGQGSWMGDTAELVTKNTQIHINNHSGSKRKNSYWVPFFKFH